MKNKSRLAKAIEARERKQYDFEVHDFFGLGNKPIHKIGIRVSTKSEQDGAVVAAHKYIEAKAGNSLSDEDILVDAKTIEVLFHACREVVEVEPGAEPPKHNYPAFPGPQWMRDNMTTDQLAVLLNLYNEVRRKESPTTWQISSEDVNALAFACAEISDSDLPEKLLARFDREWLTQAFVMLSVQLKEMRDVVQGFGQAIRDEQVSSQGDPEADQPGGQDDGDSRESGDEGEGDSLLPESHGGSGGVDEG